MSDRISETALPEAVQPASLSDRIQPRPILWLITGVAITMSLFQMYTAGIEPMGLFYQRSAHLGFILFLAFLIFPITGHTRPRGSGAAGRPGAVPRTVVVGLCDR